MTLKYLFSLRKLYTCEIWGLGGNGGGCGECWGRGVALLFLRGGGTGGG